MEKVINKHTQYIVLAPHPDDELLMAGPFTLTKYSAVILFTDGDSCAREKCFDNFVKTTGIPVRKLHLMSPIMLRLDTSYIYNQLCQSIAGLVTASTCINYTLVAPSLNDTHPEHLLVSALGMRYALERSTPIIFTSASAHEPNVLKNKKGIALLKKYYPAEYNNLVNTNYDLSPYITYKKLTLK